MGSTGDTRICNALQRLAKLHAKESHGNIVDSHITLACKNASRFDHNCCVRKIHN